MIRLGLVGVGAWGHRYMERTACRSDCAITAVARASGSAHGSIPGALACRDWEEMLGLAEARELDGLLCATAPTHQAELAAECASRGIPLLVEKPLGLCREDAERVRVALDDARVLAPLMVNYIHLYAPSFTRLRELVHEAGGARQIVRIRAVGHKTGPFRGWSTLYDYAPHDLAMALTLVGVDAPSRVLEVERVTQAGAAGELYEFRMELGGVSLAVRVGNGAESRARRLEVELVGRRVLVYDDTLEHPRKLSDSGVAVEVSRAQPLDQVLSSFVASVGCCRQGGAPPAEVVRDSTVLSCRVNALLDEVQARVSA